MTLDDKSQRLIWIDCEMTGLSPENDQLIEIAAVITDGQLNILAHSPEFAIRQHGKTRDQGAAIGQQPVVHNGHIGQRDIAGVGVEQWAQVLGIEHRQRRHNDKRQSADDGGRRFGLLTHGAYLLFHFLADAAGCHAVEAARAHPHWSAPLGPNQARGVAGGFWGNYGGPSTAAVSLGEDGSVTVTTGSPDIGGSRASNAKLLATGFTFRYDTLAPALKDCLE